MQIFDFCINLIFTFVISINFKNENFKSDILWKILKTDWLIFSEQKI